jgi:hypothetical protein
LSAANSDPLLRGRPLQNVGCPYCGAPLDQGTRTKEHVVGRRFVPVGALNNSWNLILWACYECNQRKADLEDDIAAISMHFHTAGLPQMADSRAQAEALRRSAKSGSRKTGKAVAASGVELLTSLDLGLCAELKFSFVGPPQFDDARVYELARLQMMAFFYFLTYDKTKNVGHFWTGGFFPVHGTIKSDRGNPVHRAFMAQCRNWDYRLVLRTAEGYFRAVIRRHPTFECWSWAVEWNDCHRLVGYFGPQESAQALAQELPGIGVQSVFEGPNRWLRQRAEQPLNEEDDILFHVDATTEGGLAARSRHEECQ